VSGGSKHFSNLGEAALVGYYPSMYSRMMIGHTPYPLQGEAMDCMAPDHARCLVCTCNESGKTSHLVRDLIMWHMDAKPGSLTVTTAGVNRQIGEQLYPYLQETCRSYDGWKVSCGNKYRVEAPNGSRCVSFATDDPQFAEGFHAPDRGISLWHDWAPPEGWEFNTELHDRTSFMLIIDEAKSVPYGIFRAVQRMNPQKLLICSSAPEEPTGFFVECFTQRREWFWNEDLGRYNIFGGLPEFPSTSYRNFPHLANDPKYCADAKLERDSFGEKSAFYMSMYEGLIPEEGANMLFRMNMVDEAMGGVGIKHYGAGMPRCAVDLSNGGDEIPMYVANGNKIWRDSSHGERDATRLATSLINRFEILKLRPEWITCDNTGMGDPVIDILHSRGWPVNRLDMNQAPIDKGKYANVRAEMLFELAARINAGELILEKDPTLRKQLSWHTYVMDEKGKLKVGSKDKMPNSPDRVDTVAMMMYGAPRVQSFHMEAASRARALSPTLPDKADVQYRTFSPTRSDNDGGMFY